jgi:hypothetical protein
MAMTRSLAVALTPGAVKVVVAVFSRCPPSYCPTGVEMVVSTPW